MVQRTTGGNPAGGRPPGPGRPPRPKPGDVLVSRATASLEHVVAVVPESALARHPNQERAVRQAREIARSQHVDAWLTIDHTHFIPLATHRDDPPAE